MENKERVTEALRKIEMVINEVRDLFPSIKKEQIQISTKKYDDPIKVLKKIDGIIRHYDESNAERKLENLLNFLGITSSKEE